MMLQRPSHPASIPAVLACSLPSLLLQLEEMRQNEDPRLSFATPEFKEAQRVFTDNLKVGTAGLASSALCLAVLQWITRVQPTHSDTVVQYVPSRAVLGSTCSAALQGGGSS